jgi:hypothetical protein
MAPIETVNIVSDETECGYVIINKRDFDAAVHTLFGASESETPPEKKKSKKDKPE